MTGRSDRLVVSVNVAHDSIDGEVVAIELATGTYYSLVGVAAEIWPALAAGTDARTVIDALVAAFPDEPSLDHQVEAFLDRLVTDRLIDLVDAPTGAPAVPRFESNRFTPLQAEAFTDMQDLMLLDPVHDVDTTIGWPVADPSNNER